MDQHEALVRAACIVMSDLRIQKKLSHSDLARKTGLHRSYIADLDGGARNISIPNIGHLAEAFGLSASAFIKLAEAKVAQIMASPQEFTRVKDAKLTRAPKQSKKTNPPKAEPASTANYQRAIEKVYRRCLNGHRWTGKASNCANCQLPGLIVQGIFKTAIVKTAIVKFYRRCLNGHRWTGKKSNCANCQLPGFIVQGTFKKQG